MCFTCHAYVLFKLSLEEPKRHRFKRITSMFMGLVISLLEPEFGFAAGELCTQTLDPFAGVLLD